MFTTEDHEFIDFLFGKLTCLTDTEMIDLQMMIPVMIIFNLNN